VERGDRDAGNKRKKGKKNVGGTKVDSWGPDGASKRRASIDTGRSPTASERRLPVASSGGKEKVSMGTGLAGHKN